MEQSNQFLGTERIGKLMTQYAVPCIISLLVGAIANIILDPIFIFLFRWGMMGAAVATVIGQILTALLSAWYILHMKIIKPSKKGFSYLSVHDCSCLYQQSLLYLPAGYGQGSRLHRSLHDP